MAWKSSGSTHTDLINNLFKNRVITSETVKNTMLHVDRAYFAKSSPYEDRPSSIGYGATISAPHMHAYALEALKDHLKPGAHALDVGSGSGYLTACMALMVGPTGVAVGIEHVDKLTDFSLSNVRNWFNHSQYAQSSGIELGKQLKLVTGDGRQGWLPDAPYDAIHVGAAAHMIPDAEVALTSFFLYYCFACFFPLRNQKVVSSMQPMHISCNKVLIVLCCYLDMISLMIFMYLV
ncbi:Protein-L-isoaspartate(D-aspartate) O-methyltransferase [Schistosoma japonicum]|nr:Protein-L-isoaspartate(D-aspartate) O-methyltransferase [Schistosoma japonicum]